MTCASCASRIERSLNELDSVEATVNLAAETASGRWYRVDGSAVVIGVATLSAGPQTTWPGEFLPQARGLEPYSADLDLAVGNA
jgi:Cu+-exporting ATPase